MVFSRRQWSRAAGMVLLVALQHQPALAQPLPPEIKVGGADIVDFEFDWARDGVHCPSCNFGAGNSRFAYIDNSNKLWVGYVDFSTGNFYPPNGQGALVDSYATTPKQIGNGPEWVFSQRGSELVYTRWTDGKPMFTPNVTMGYAYMGNGSWVAGSVANSNLQVLPVGSLDLDDSVPSVHYQYFTRPGQAASLRWRFIAPGAVEQAIPNSSTDPGVTRRWVPGTRDIIITAEAAADAPGAGYRQVFLYHTTSGQLEQLTSDLVSKYWSFMWRAPEYDNDFVFCSMVDGKTLNIYRKVSVGGAAAQWTVVNSINMPAATPYLSSPEPFVHNGQSWVFFSLSATKPSRNLSSTSLIAMTGIVAGVPSLRLLTSDNSPARSRRDPEHFVSANGPQIYYNRYLTGSGTLPPVSEGVYRVDTGLGPRLP